MKNTLYTQILMVLVFIFSFLGATAYVIHRSVLQPSFLKLEERHVVNAVQRIVDALENEQNHLALVANDWSSWDDTYRFVSDHNREYMLVNLVEATFPINQINLLYLLDNLGNKVWGKIVGEDFVSPIALEPFNAERFSPEFPLFRSFGAEVPLNQQVVKGLLMTRAGPMFCVSRPILDSNDQGPSRGTLIMGRLLGTALSQKIATLAGTTFDIRIRQDAAFPLLREQSPASSPISINYSDVNATFTGSVTLADLNGVSLLELIVNSPSEILAQGLKSLRLSLALLATGAALALALMFLLLQLSVVAPINRFSKNILKRRNAERSTDNALAVGTHASLEVQLLAQEFDQLLSNLDAKNDELVAINRTLCEETEKLKQAEVRLKHLDVLKSEFISTAAHELRTPVASIMGFAEILASLEITPLLSDEQKKDCLQEIHGNAGRLSRLIDDILDISRIEAGHPIPINQQPSSIRFQLEKVVSQFRLKAKHQLILDVSQEVPEVLLFDPHRINQVLDNLLSNALKYSPGGSTVVILAEPNGDHCKVTVIDQGIGMTEEQKMRMFDKFYRADASNTSVRGLGLGMSIVKQIIEDHGCSIWVDSEYGKGTRVSFTLPADQFA